MWATLERRSFKTVSRVVTSYAMLHAALHRHLFTIVGTIARAHHLAVDRARDRTIAIAPPHRRAAAVSLVLVPNGHALCDLVAPADPADDYFPEPGVAPRANDSRGRTASQAGFLNERTT
ncbi:hypothetical protein LGM75_25895 [Burkholderia multivorans]|uniref:hypothetical protein n=1 Tax=Burkholderia multivorans TaxID=87883 RepID=UPI001E3EEEDB|nr:hypothetical protein [Burkholderia multivorans]MCA8129791.1 hypothetical protein [Burkholderia multivorans]